MPRVIKNKEKLTKVVPFRLTEQEFMLFKEKVSSSGMTQSEFFRDCVLANKTVVISKKKCSLEKKRMQLIFNTTGNNISQIAHNLNRANKAGQLSNPLFESTLRNLGNIANYLKSALNHAD